MRPIFRNAACALPRSASSSRTIRNGFSIEGECSPPEAFFQFRPVSTLARMRTAVSPGGGRGNSEGIPEEKSHPSFVMAGQYRPAPALPAAAAMLHTGGSMDSFVRFIPGAIDLDAAAVSRMGEPRRRRRCRQTARCRAGGSLELCVPT